MNMRFSVVSTHFYRGQIAGHLVRVQVHRNVGGHQSQCGRAAGRSAVADPAEAGESGEVAVGVLCLSGQLYHHQLTPLVFCCWKSVHLCSDLFRKRSCRKHKRRACSPLGNACLAGSGGTNPPTPVSLSGGGGGGGLGGIPPIISGALTGNAGQQPANDSNTPPSSVQSR